MSAYDHQQQQQQLMRPDNVEEEEEEEDEEEDEEQIQGEYNEEYYGKSRTLSMDSLFTMYLFSPKKDTGQRSFSPICDSELGIHQKQLSALNHAAWVPCDIRSELPYFCRLFVSC